MVWQFSFCDDRVVFFSTHIIMINHSLSAAIQIVVNEENKRVRYNSFHLISYIYLSTRVVIDRDGDIRLFVCLFECTLQFGPANGKILFTQTFVAWRSAGAKSNAAIYNDMLPWPRNSNFDTSAATFLGVYLFVLFVYLFSAPFWTQIFSVSIWIWFPGIFEHLSFEELFCMKTWHGTTDAVATWAVNRILLLAHQTSSSPTIYIFLGTCCRMTIFYVTLIMSEIW